MCHIELLHKLLHHMKDTDVCKFCSLIDIVFDTYRHLEYSFWMASTTEVNVGVLIKWSV